MKSKLNSSLPRVRVADDIGLSMALRATKYDLKKVMERNDNFFLLRKSFPKYVDFSDEAVMKCYGMLDDAVVLPLLKRDNKGRAIMYMSFGKRDSKKYTSADMYRLLSCVGSVMSEAEETQLAGFVQIFDGTGVDFSHVPSLTDLQFLSQISQNASMIRVKKIILYNFPAFASTTIRMAQSMMSKKIASRFAVIDKKEKFADHVRPQSILPDILGGDQPLEKVVEDAKKYMYSENSRRVMRMHDIVEVEWHKVPRKRWIRWLSSFVEYRE